MGRFFSNKTGSHTYGFHHDVGMDDALVQLGWDIEGFIADREFTNVHSDVQSMVNLPDEVSNET